MTGDWAAVATAVRQRMAELGLTQHAVTERAHLSKATVREIQHNLESRNRKANTLQDLSVGLDWNPGHLAAVLEGRIPPGVDEPFARSADDIPGRLNIIEHRLNLIIDRLDKVASVDDRLSGFVEQTVEEAVRQTILRLRNPAR